MPFVQRVVSPTFLSRSGYGRANTQRSVVTATAPTSQTSAGYNGVCAVNLGCGGNTKDRHCSKESDVIGQQTSSDGEEDQWALIGRSGERAGQNPLIVNGYELESVINITLSNVLRQLASLVVIANDIFLELNEELQNIGDRSKKIKHKITELERKVNSYDPKTVSVPESDLDTFAQIKHHFESNHCFDKELFTIRTRSRNIQSLYEAAAKPPALCTFEQFRISDSTDSLDFREKTRELRTKIDAEIETRLPAAVGELRKWTSLEALGDITVTPDCINRVCGNYCANNKIFPTVSTEESSTILECRQNAQELISTDDLPLDHLLPSPEEQCQIIALKFPAEIIPVDTSGRRFERMCLARKSLTNCSRACDQDNIDNDPTIRRSRSRKSRGKRRNTIAGTDKKEIEQATNGETALTKQQIDLSDIECSITRSKSNDIAENDTTLFSSTLDVGKTAMTKLNSLKMWGRSRLKLINRNDDKKEKIVLDTDQGSNDAVSNKSKKKIVEKERKPSCSSSEKSLATSPIAPENCASINPVKLRESASARRQRRNGFSHKEEPHSSSGNWSASSESGRASIGSEITIQPKSSASSTSLNHSNAHPSSGPPSSVISRRRFLNTSASSSVTSEGTATPDLQINDLCYDDETSSAYSCDTEGYYTSFHVDSGLKTLKEEELITPNYSISTLCTTNTLEHSLNQTVLTAENEYELFGHGSTSTTTSSAGTVCTTLMAAGSDKSLLKVSDATECKPSLTKLARSSSNTSSSTLERSCSSSTVGSTLERSGTVKRNGILVQKQVSVMVHEECSPITVDIKKSREDSPDSGNNTSSSPLENNSNKSPSLGLPSNSEFECSECSDLEGIDRLERIKQKTTINSSRIPSMCIITPTTSDDENFKDNATAEHTQSSTGGKEYVLHFASDTKEGNNRLNLSKRASLQPLNNMLGKLRGVFPHIKKSLNTNPTMESLDHDIYDSIGEYVTISDVTNNNSTAKHGTGIYYANDAIKRNLSTVLSGKLDQETEYVSLNELPCNLRREDRRITDSQGVQEIDKVPATDIPTADPSSDNRERTIEERELSKASRVKFDARGKVIYNSDSLKRRKASHTTFIPGPFVKELECLTVTLPVTEKEEMTTSYKSNKIDDMYPESNRNVDVVFDCTNITSERNDNKEQDYKLINSFERQYPTKGYQHSSLSRLNIRDEERSLPSIFEHNNQMFWTLQNKRTQHSTLNSVSNELNETEINTWYSKSMGASSRSLSPDFKPQSPNNQNFITSTPQGNKHVPVPFSELSSMHLSPIKQRYDSKRNCTMDLAKTSKTCSDRLGTSKTSLMDFKKLLLAKSSKTPTTNRISAVEMLKLNKSEVNQSRKSTNSGMNIIELSGSPKTFGSRRMLKQGVFSSPSKSLMMKQRGGWRLNVSRTDVISTAIPEANTEEDNSSSGSSSFHTEDSAPKNCPLKVDIDPVMIREANVNEENVNSGIVTVQTGMILPQRHVIEGFIFNQKEHNVPVRTNFRRSNLIKDREQFFASVNTNKEQETNEQFVNHDVLNEENVLSSADKLLEGIVTSAALETAL